MKRFRGQVFFNVQPAEEYGQCFVEVVWGQLFEYSEQLYFYRRIHLLAPHNAHLSDATLDRCRALVATMHQRDGGGFPSFCDRVSAVSARSSAAIEPSPVFIW
jgi:hypothetical protein